MNGFLILEAPEGEPVLVNFQYVSHVIPADPENPDGPCAVYTIHGQTPFVVSKSLKEIFKIMQGRIRDACRRITVTEQETRKGY